MRFAVDTGGTFTDLVIEDAGGLSVHKSSTVPSDPVQGILDVFEVAARARGVPREELLGAGSALIHGTTRALNAVLTGSTARTAFLTTSGSGTSAVCLLWSIVNPEHELRVGEILAEHAPDVAVTLSHRVNPCLREYRRASSAAIDASLKPVMTEYLNGLRRRLGEAGFDGRILIVTSSGGTLDAEEIAAAPIHSLNSGPAMAPIAGRFFSADDAEADMAIVADTGGTSYDVSVVRRGRIPWTRESWIGEAYFGHMTGFPSVDVRSVGAGGGSIAGVDSGGLLHVGPESAAADPGPACYGQGGTRPTTTDACLLLGLLDPEYFLGGRATLDVDAAREAVSAHVGEPLGLEPREAAGAILRVATERMVSAIEEITIHEGIDPRSAVLVGGGGAAGFNSVAIARQLGCPQVLIPSMGPALSAAGALISELSRSFELPLPATDAGFDFEAVNAVLGELESRAEAFARGPGKDAISSGIDFSVEARYPQQVWELEVPLPGNRIEGPEDLRRLCEEFHAVHRDVFAVADEASQIEFQSWHARVHCRLAEPAMPKAETIDAEPVERQIYLPGLGELTASVWRIAAVPLEAEIEGPAIVEMPTTTVLIDPGATFRRRASGTLQIRPERDGPVPQASGAEAERSGR